MPDRIVHSLLVLLRATHWCCDAEEHPSAVNGIEAVAAAVTRRLKEIEKQVGGRLEFRPGRKARGSESIRPPGGKAILLCVYSTEAKTPANERENAVAEVARMVLETFGKSEAKPALN